MGLFHVRISPAKANHGGYFNMLQKRQREQSLYVLAASSGEVKIGIAADPQSRWAAQPYVSVSGTTIWELEAAVHERLAHLRLNGEWFDIRVEDARKEIEAIFKETQPLIFKPLIRFKKRKPPKNDGCVYRCHKRSERRLLIEKALADSTVTHKEIAKQFGVPTHRVGKIAQRSGIKRYRIKLGPFTAL
jgi:T5orf172 domain